MIDTDIINELLEPERSDARNALATLYVIGVFDLQEKRELTRLASGSPDEKEDTLAMRVIAYRRKSADLRALSELGESIIKEQNNGLE